LNKVTTCLLKEVCACLLLAATALYAADWPTFAHDPQRTGWAFEEDTLNLQNVANLELKWKTQVKNEPKSLTALTAPVVAENVVTTRGMKTLVYVAGSDDHFYALDAKDGSVVWSHDFDHHVLPKDAGMWLCPNGVNATPTIDRTRNVAYTISFDGRLWGLDLGTGEPRFGPVQFVNAFSKNWSLNLFGGIVYTSISQDCAGARSGIYSMDIRDTHRPVIQDLIISNKGGAGVWGRGGPAIGRNGRIYAAAGDGEFNPTNGAFGSSVIAATLRELEIVDYYMPTDFRDVTKYDLDMGASSPVWFSDKDANLVAVGGKQGVLYLLNADSLGDKDHQTPLYIRQLSNDDRSYEQKGIWGGLSSWKDEDGQAWVYVPVWGPVSTKAPAFPVNNGPTPHGCVMAFKVVVDGATKKPTLEPAWISGDFDVPEPVVIANGVVLALSSGENTQQTTGTNVVYAGQKLLTDTERSKNTHNAVLYALDAKTGKVLYQSGNAITGWVHFSGLAVADGRVYAVDHDSRVYCFGLKSK
jgi:outer membrane protein assembly factor BamB